ncbi:MAG: ATP-binding protein [Prevotellaceae bacterium]|nr:ATP-binding protein [Prevotellaceae bacterium]
MKRHFCILLLLLSVIASPVKAAVGHPFFVNFLPEEYAAHNRNFDVLSDDKGRVFVANFEGLLCYDQSQWKVIHAPGIFRITRLFKDSKGRIWVGGYNVFGYLTSAKNGELQLKTIFSRDNKGFIGEVTSISEENGKICIETSIGTAGLEDNSMAEYKIEKTPADNPILYKGVKVNDSVNLSNGMRILATAGLGLVVLSSDGSEMYHLTERAGLCNDNINAVFADAYGNVWGATDDGIFLTDIFTAYTSFQSTDGISGEVLSICQKFSDLYVGTLRGLFVKRNNAFERVGDISNACWSLCLEANGNVCAATAGGIYLIRGAKTQQLSKTHTISVCPIGNGRYYAGEINGVFLIDNNGNRKQVNTIEKAITFIPTKDGSLWIRNIYGQVFRCTGDYSKLNEVLPEGEKQAAQRYNYTLVEHKGNIFMIGRLGAFKWNAAKGKLEKFDSKGKWRSENRYPQLAYNDCFNRIWTTNNEGNNIQVFSMTSDLNDLNQQLRPVHNLNVRSLEVDGNDVWLGGNFGLICWNSDYRDNDFNHKAKVYIRSIVMNNDSVIWGGFNAGDKLDTQMPFRSLDFESDVQSITIHFSTDMISTLGDTEYRYRLNGSQQWSQWSKDTYVKLSNPRPGRYSFEVMARDRYGRVTNSVKFDFKVHYPVYVRWYFFLLYLFALAVIVVIFIRWRMARLLKEKLRLEAIVEERTSQIRQQKDEIEEKSNSLEKALEDLNAAQYQLLRQERMATVGTLTKGLVDRILNPMNYVNNFSHMSLGLLKDIKENLEDEEEKMTPDNYDDCLDIVDMLNTNLTKIEEHGINTTRILKAMEEMLKERKCNIEPVDLASLCRKNIEMTTSYYAKEIADCHITVESSGIDTTLMADIDAEQISRVVMSMIGNSIYAVVKKYGQKQYSPVVRLSLAADKEQGKVVLSIYDNGIGIESTIIDKIFDPFFTTKTTAEAVGVGMYLSREIVLNHGGEINVKSTKEVETQFTISIPTK